MAKCLILLLIFGLSTFLLSLNVIPGRGSLLINIYDELTPKNWTPSFLKNRRIGVGRIRTSGVLISRPPHHCHLRSNFDKVSLNRSHYRKREQSLHGELRSECWRHGSACRHGWMPAKQVMQILVLGSIPLTFFQVRYLSNHQSITCSSLRRWSEFQSMYC